MNKTIVTCALLALTGCQSTTLPPPPPSKPYTLNADEKEAVQDGVRRSLKDPTSAVFGSMVASEQGEGIKTVCGVVNAKNSFGGYTGSKLYMGTLGSLKTQGKTVAVFSVNSMGGTETDSQVTETMCRHYGVF